MEQVYKKVKAITFGMFSPELIKKMAAAKIVTPELYDKEGYPVDGGLMDIRLGVIDPGLRCKTCGGTLRDCMGHFGYMDLARPLIHINYADVILAALRSTCRECSGVLTDKPVKVEVMIDDEDKEEIEIIAAPPITEVVQKVIKKSTNKAAKKCPSCNAKQYSIKLEKPTTFLEDDKRLTPIQIKARLEKISEETIEKLGINPKNARPDWMILIVLPVPPVTIRPSITLESGERSEDDLTHKLGDIVRINQRLFENINAGAPEVIVEDLWELLQYHVTTYFNNETSQVPPARHRSGGQALRTLAERIKSKEGRFRYNLAGKRVNFAARTVISPDSKIELNEVGVPLQVAMELTIPERITEWNIKRLKEFVKKGPKSYPGSNYVVRPDGKKKKITDETQEQLLEELQPGYVVERHLMDGDISVFNRQPSLHRMSIMAHRVKVLDGKSFRLNPAVTNPYAADFDGDEMNLHIPQTEEARAEAEVLMLVQNQINSPKDGLNVIGCSADAITGNYLLTRDVEMSKEDAIQLLTSIGVFDNTKFEKFKKIVTGKEIFSALLPSDFNFIGNSKDKKEVIIKKGQLIEGIIDQATVGQDKGDLIRALYARYGTDLGVDLLGKIFRLGIASLLHTGFTTTISDTDLPSDISEKCKELINNSEKRVNQLIEQYENKELIALPGLTLETTLEIKIMEVLNRARNKVGEIISEIIDINNPTVIMAISGAKGNTLNLAQMAGCVGQQALRGRRIDIGFKGRVLSSFLKGELTPKSHGFIKGGYKQGLSPEEYFMHAMTGRESLMDTALRTPKAGYLYRRLSSALQDVKVCYDETVRDANNNLIQIKYGEDGLDVSKTEGGKINVQRIVKEVIGE